MIHSRRDSCYKDLQSEKKREYCKFFLVSSHTCPCGNGSIRFNFCHFSAVFSKDFESNIFSRLSARKHTVLDCHYQFDTGSLKI